MKKHKRRISKLRAAIGKKGGLAPHPNGRGLSAATADTVARVRELGIAAIKARKAARQVKV